MMDARDEGMLIVEFDGVEILDPEWDVVVGNDQLKAQGVGVLHSPEPAVDLASNRTLISAAIAAAKLIEPGEDEALTNSFGAAFGIKRWKDHDIPDFDDEPDSGEPSAMTRGAPEGRLVKVGDSLLPEAVVVRQLREAALAMAARASATGPTKPATPASTGSKTRRRRTPSSGG
jgi:hypothetical protein